jgi:ectoine hydroxylase-related dioxygenase (phytanoyl-CoA dioxygenase family)
LDRLSKELNECYSRYVPNFVDIDSAIKDLDIKDKSLLYDISKSTGKLLTFKEIAVSLMRHFKSKRTLFEVSNGYIIGLPGDDRITYDYHQESSYWVDYKYDVTTVQYSISDRLSKDNGSMSVLVGSHKLGTLKYNKSEYKQHSTMSNVPVDIDKYKNKYEEHVFELERGDCAFFHKDLIHRSNTNITNTVRLAGAVRFAQEFKI